MIAAVCFVILGISVAIALLAKIGVKEKGIGQFLVGGRTFPSWLLYFLAVGEVYSVGTMIAFPGAIYEKGASYGIWFLGYILLAYPLGYFLTPLIWRAGKRHDALTVPDVFGRHFDSRTLELLSTLVMFLSMVTLGAYQLVGLQVVLGALGIGLSPVTTILIGCAAAFVYVAFTGMRSPALVAVFKDFVMLAGIAAVGVAAVAADGGFANAFRARTGSLLTHAAAPVVGQPMVFALTTIVIQAVVFYLSASAQLVFPAKSEKSISSSIVWMPVYMLMYVFLVFASYYAIHAYPDVREPDTIFMVMSRDLLPEWLVGVVAGGAVLAGVMTMGVIGLGLSGVVIRNVVPNVRVGAQRPWSVGVIAAFMVLSAVLAYYGQSLAVLILNFANMLLGQLVPGWVAVLWQRRVNPNALSAGIVAGLLLSLYFYVSTPPSAASAPHSSRWSSTSPSCMPGAHCVRAPSANRSHAPAPTPQQA